MCSRCDRYQRTVRRYKPVDAVPDHDGQGARVFRVAGGRRVFRDAHRGRVVASRVRRHHRPIPVPEDSGPVHDSGHRAGNRILRRVARPARGRRRR